MFEGLCNFYLFCCIFFLIFVDQLDLVVFINLTCEEKSIKIKESQPQAKAYDRILTESTFL